METVPASPSKLEVHRGAVTAIRAYRMAAAADDAQHISSQLLLLHALMPRVREPPLLPSDGSSASATTFRACVITQ